MTWAQFVLLPAAIFVIAAVRVGWVLYRGRRKN